MVLTSQGMMNSRKLHDFDFYMVLTTAFLIGFGVVAIWSAQGGGQLSILNEGVRQAIFAIIGAMLLVFVASFNYRFLGTAAWLLYAGSLASLVLVLVPGIGISIAGSRRGSTGYHTVQPSEFAKLATIIALSSFVHRAASKCVNLAILRFPLICIWYRQGWSFSNPTSAHPRFFRVIWFSIIVTTGCAGAISDRCSCRSFP